LTWLEADKQPISNTKPSPHRPSRAVGQPGCGRRLPQPGLDNWR